MNIGERFGDYEIVGILGTGGMGQVYKVHNILTDRFDAMKVLLPNMSSNLDLAQRFLREIQVQAALDHPNIAQLRTAQQIGDQLVMVMELVEGSTVEALMEQGTLNLEKSVNYVSQVLDALAYAHSKGVVHRDVKPANIMVTNSGVAKLMDFGIARMQSDRHLTKTGVAVGSLYYMSPEQIQGGEPDARSDLYALGVTLYEMVTGQRPFKGDSDYSIMAAHLQQVPVPPIQIVPGVPQDLSDIILTAVARDAAARFQSATAFRNALGSLSFAPGAAPVSASAPSAVTRTMATPVPPAPVAAPPPQAASPSVTPPPGYAPPPVYTPPAPAAPAAMAVNPNPPSRRGLYMLLGSLATVAALVVALIEVPKFRHAQADQTPAAEASSSPAAPGTPAPAAATPAAPDNPAPVASADSTPAAPADAAPSPAQLSAEPQPAPAPAAQAASHSAAPAQKAGGGVLAPRPRPANPAPSQIAQQGVPVPAQAASPSRQPAQAAPVAQQVPQQAQAAPAAPAQPDGDAAPAPASSGQMKALRKEYDRLAVRAGAAESSLGNIKSQMARQGLGLRRDMVEAEGRMNLAMQEAQDALRDGDAKEAREDLDTAQHALESIDKFLGR